MYNNKLRAGAGGGGSKTCLLSLDIITLSVSDGYIMPCMPLLLCVVILHRSNDNGD